MVELRKAGLEDVNALLRLYNECRKECLLSAMNREDVQSRVQKKDVWIAHEEEYIGFTEIEIICQRTGNYKIKFCVDNNHREMGFGKALLEEIESLLKEEYAATKIEVHIAEDCSCKTFLEKMGYEEEAKLKRRWWKGKAVAVSIYSKLLH